jgi:hypothetical protein
MRKASVEKTLNLIQLGEAFVKEVKALLSGCPCPENVETQQDWDEANVVNHAESMIEEVNARIVVMREECE